MEGTSYCSSPVSLISGGWAEWMSGILGNGGTLSVTNTISLDQIFYRVISE